MKIFILALILLSNTLLYSQNSLKYLALGDSYTIGVSVTKSEAFPALLTAKLRNAGILVAEPKVIAKNGWATNDLSDALDEEEPLGKYDFVTLLIGVNNQYIEQDADEFRIEFIRLLNRAAGYATSIKNVIVLSLPDWGVTEFAVKKGRNPEKIAKEIERYNSIIKEEAEKAGAYFIAITDISKEAAIDTSLLADDKLHGSRKMYSRWAERIFPIANQIIETK